MLCVQYQEWIISPSVFENDVGIIYLCIQLPFKLADARFASNRFRERTSRFIYRPGFYGAMLASADRGWNLLLHIFFVLFPLNRRVSYQSCVFA